MNDEYKELYYFLFNKISDMIQELQQLQQQAEEAYIAGFGYAKQSGMQEQTASAANPVGDFYVPPKVNVSHVYVPDDYVDDAIMRDDIGKEEQQRDESARCQSVNDRKMLTFEKRKAAAQLEPDRHKQPAQSQSEREIVWRPMAE